MGSAGVGGGVGGGGSGAGVGAGIGPPPGKMPHVVPFADCVDVTFSFMWHDFWAATKANALHGASAKHDAQHSATLAASTRLYAWSGHFVDGSTVAVHCAAASTGAVDPHTITKNATSFPIGRMRLGLETLWMCAFVKRSHAQ